MLGTQIAKRFIGPNGFDKLRRTDTSAPQFFLHSFRFIVPACLIRYAAKEGIACAH
jgi:hypothetical protein